MTAPGIVARFRPTRLQAVGRGAYLGLGLGLGGLLALLVYMAPGLAAGLAATTGARAHYGATTAAAEAALPAWTLTRPRRAVWLVLAAPPTVGPLVGALAGLVLRRFTGTEVGAAGIRARPGRRSALAPWSRVRDVRAERRGSRTSVAVYLDTGQVERLGAPYDGRLGTRDPQFERKVFMLRHMLQTHGWRAPGRQ
jgi:hypothetical protein